MDLVTVNQDASTVRVLLTVGNGTFALHVDFALPETPRRRALGDLNGDGILDLAAPVAPPANARRGARLVAQRRAVRLPPLGVPSLACVQESPYGEAGDLA